MPLFFNPAGSADADRIGALHADSWRRHYRGAYSDAYLDGNLVSERRTVWTSRLAAPTGTRTILAERDGRLIGFVHVVLDADLRWGSLVDNLHVLHSEHRTGLGTQLMAHAARAVLADGRSPALYLWVLQQNTRAQAFYHATGGTNVESALASPPQGNPAFLNGAPGLFRMSWPDAVLLAQR